MNNTTLNNAQQPIAADEVLKATALIYLREALEKEEYETCAEFIASAESFGAQRSEIKEVLKGYLADKR